MAAELFPEARLSWAKGEWGDWLNDNVRALLLKSGVTPSATWKWVADAVAAGAEVATPGTMGYTRLDVTGRTVSLVGSGFAQRAHCKASNPKWVGLAVTGGVQIGLVVLYRLPAAGNDGNSPLLGYVNGSPLPVDASGDFEVQWEAGQSSGLVLTR